MITHITRGPQEVRVQCRNMVYHRHSAPPQFNTKIKLKIRVEIRVCAKDLKWGSRWSVNMPSILSLFSHSVVCIRLCCGVITRNCIQRESRICWFNDENETKCNKCIGRKKHTLTKDLVHSPLCSSGRAHSIKCEIEQTEWQTFKWLSLILDLKTVTHMKMIQDTKQARNNNIMFLILRWKNEREVKNEHGRSIGIEFARKEKNVPQCPENDNTKKTHANEWAVCWPDRTHRKRRSWCCCFLTNNQRTIHILCRNPNCCIIVVHTVNGCEEEKRQSDIKREHKRLDNGQR